MTPTTIDRLDTSESLPTREVHAEMARQEQAERPALTRPSHGNPLTGWVPPSSWADEPTPIFDTLFAEQDHRDYGRGAELVELETAAEREARFLFAAWVDEHARWAAAEMREVVAEVAPLPPHPAARLAPQVLDAEAAEREQHHDGLQRRADDRRRRPAHAADTPGEPDKQRLPWWRRAGDWLAGVRGDG